MPIGFKLVLFIISFANLITLVVPVLQFLLLLFLSNNKRFGVHCLGYPLANFQLLMMPQHIDVTFCENPANI